MSMCLGPVDTAAGGFCATHDTFQDGCTMFACQHATGGFVPRAAWADTVFLTPSAGAILAFFESIYGTYSIDGSGDAQVVTW